MKKFFKSKLWNWMYMTFLVLFLTIGFILNSLIMISIGTILLVIVYYPEFKDDLFWFSKKNIKKDLAD